MREEYLESNPIDKIPVPKGITRVVNTFTHEQIAKLADECLKANENGYRNLIIILLLLDSGIRVPELVGSELSDVKSGRGRHQDQKSQRKQGEAHTNRLSGSEVTMEIH